MVGGGEARRCDVLDGELVVEEEVAGDLPDEVLRAPRRVGLALEEPVDAGVGAPGGAEGVESVEDGDLGLLEAEGDARLPAEAPRLRAEVVVDELERGVEAVGERGVLLRGLRGLEAALLRALERVPSAVVPALLRLSREVDEVLGPVEEDEGRVARRLGQLPADALDEAPRGRSTSISRV